MVNQLERVVAETDPVTLAIIHRQEHIAQGIDAVFLGLASRILSGKMLLSDEPPLDLESITIDTLISSFQRHRDASPFHRVPQPYGVIRLGETESLHRLAQHYYTHFFLNEFELPELMKDVSLAMVAGQQGSGKDSLQPVFDQLGYSGASMSQAVQDVATAWGYERTDTDDKITVGKKLKSILGQGILVPITAARMAAKGNKNIVMFGPRVIEEAEAVLELGGILVGIATAEDYETDRKIRKERIKRRADIDPTRARDEAKFDDRERMEAAGVAAILSHPQCHLFIDNSPKEVFGDHLKEFITPLLKRKI